MLKPTGLNRGRGIHVFNNLKRLEQLLNQYYDGFYEVDPDDKLKKVNNVYINERMRYS
jgi:hypothetical protein